MGRMVLLAAFLLAAVATTASPAFAQAGEVAPPSATDEQPAPSRDDDTLYFGEYAVTEDGTLIIGGDVSIRCEDVGLSDGALPGANDPAAQAQMEQSMREMIRACRAAGFPTAADVPASASATASASASGNGSALPDTGGSALQPVLLVMVLCAAIIVTASVFSTSLAKRR